MKIVLRNEALQRNLIRYYTGRPCKHGHIAERNTLTSACLSCLGIDQKKRRRRVSDGRLLAGLGFKEVTVRIWPEDSELLDQFVALLNKWHLAPDGVDYIKLLSDHAAALYQASILFVEEKDE